MEGEFIMKEYNVLIMGDCDVYRTAVDWACSNGYKWNHPENTPYYEDVSVLHLDSKGTITITGFHEVSGLANLDYTNLSKLTQNNLNNIANLNGCVTIGTNEVISHLVSLGFKNELDEDDIISIVHIETDGQWGCLTNVHRDEDITDAVVVSIEDILNTKRPKRTIKLDQEVSEEQYQKIQEILGEK